MSRITDSYLANTSSYLWFILIGWFILFELSEPTATRAPVCCISPQHFTDNAAPCIHQRLACHERGRSEPESKPAAGACVSHSVAVRRRRARRCGEPCWKSCTAPGNLITGGRELDIAEGVHASACTQPHAMVAYEDCVRSVQGGGDALPGHDKGIRAEGRRPLQGDGVTTLAGGCICCAYRGVVDAPCRRPYGAANRDQDGWVGQRQGPHLGHRSAADRVRCGAIAALSVRGRALSLSAWLHMPSELALWSGRTARPPSRSPALNNSHHECAPIPVLLTPECADAGGTNRQPGAPAGGGGWRVLLVDSEKHDEPKIVKAITRVVPNCDENHAKVRRYCRGD